MRTKPMVIALAILTLIALSVLSVSVIAEMNFNGNITGDNNTFTINDNRSILSDESSNGFQEWLKTTEGILTTITGGVLLIVAFYRLAIIRRKHTKQKRSIRQFVLILSFMILLATPISEASATMNFGEITGNNNSFTINITNNIFVFDDALNEYKRVELNPQIEFEEIIGGILGNRKRSGTIVVTGGTENFEAARVRYSTDTQSDANIIGMINLNERYECVEVAENGWYGIVYPTGRIGYVSNKFCRYEESTFETITYSHPIGEVTVKGGDVRSYTGPNHAQNPNVKYAGSIKSGQKVICLGQSDDWYAVVLPPEQQSWVVYIYKDYADFVKW